jgi:hypothetical protein
MTGRVRVNRAAKRPPEYYEPDWPRCGARSGETLILCQRPKGHAGPHRNGAVKWGSAAEKIEMGDS